MTRGPQLIGDILAELMAQKGFAGVRSAKARDAAWREAVGELTAGCTEVGTVRRGVLAVTVANSTLVQELMFQKPEIVRTLAQLLPDARIRDVRFRGGPVG